MKGLNRYFLAIITLSIIVIVIVLIVTIPRLSKMFTSQAQISYNTENNQRSGLVAEYNNSLTDYQANENLFNSAQLPQKEQYLSVMKINNDNAIGTSQKILNIDKELLKLKLSNDTIAYLKKIYSIDEQQYNYHKSNSELIERKTVLIEYFLLEDRSETCFNNIDFSSDNKNISTQINLCISLLEAQKGKVDTISLTYNSNFPITLKAINDKVTYWTTSSELYDHFDSNDKIQIQNDNQQFKAVNSNFNEETLNSHLELNTLLLDGITSNINSLKSSIETAKNAL